MSRCSTSGFDISLRSTGAHAIAFVKEHAHAQMAILSTASSLLCRAARGPRRLLAVVVGLFLAGPLRHIVRCVHADDMLAK